MSAREDDKGFLARWSRLKRDPEKPLDTAPPAPAEPALPEGRTLEELVAELPRIDDLAPGQSLSAFMQSWVPADIRSAALRRMWLLDPAIRDYVNPALDYAYDYNIPGGAPGFGPMETSAEMVREVTDMFARAVGGGNDDSQRRSAEANMSQPDAAAAERDAAAQPALPQISADWPKTADAPDVSSGIVAEYGFAGPPRGPEDDVAVHENPHPRNDLPPVPRRHGGALPS